jgi:hypothetical protein
MSNPDTKAGPSMNADASTHADAHHDTISVSLGAVIVTLRAGLPQVLTVDAAGPASAAPTALAALPFGPLDPAQDVTLERALLRWVQEQTGLTLDWIEQLYTLGDQYRDPAELAGGPRAVSVAYLALVEAGSPLSAAEAHWKGVYTFFPWEDWREGRPGVIDDEILPVLMRWADAEPDEAARHARHERAEIAFGGGQAPWDDYRVLERYELLYEVGLAEEAHRDARLRRSAGASLRYPPWLDQPGEADWVGLPMANDHRRILATSLGRLRGKLRYRPLVFDLLPETFTLLELQQVVESLAGVRLHKGNFRRLVEKGGLVEGTGTRSHTGGRPAERFRFRREVLRERRAPGVGLPRRG